MGSFLSAVAAICFLEWGLIHIAAGALTILPALKDDVSTYLINLYGGLDEQGVKAIKEATFPPYTSRVLLQHGFNLGWAGLWSCALVYGVLMKDPPRNLFLLGMAPYLLDWGYFIGIDLANLGSKMGEAQTFIVSTGLACSALIVHQKYGVSNTELAVTLGTSSLLFGAALLNQFGLLSKYKREGYESM